MGQLAAVQALCAAKADVDCALMGAAPGATGFAPKAFRLLRLTQSAEFPSTLGSNYCHPLTVLGVWVGFPWQPQQAERRCALLPWPSLSENLSRLRFMFYYCGFPVELFVFLNNLSRDA